jgi:hypothetical protein
MPNSMLEVTCTYPDSLGSDLWLLSGVDVAECLRLLVLLHLVKMMADLRLEAEWPEVLCTRPEVGEQWLKLVNFKTVTINLSSKFCAKKLLPHIKI